MNSVRKFVCDVNLGGCGRNAQEPQGMDGFRGYVGGNVPKDIEIEYIDLCEKCGDKRLKEQKLMIRVLGAASAGLITEDELKAFGHWGKFSTFEKKIFIENLQKKEMLAKKKQKENQMKRLLSKEDMN